MSSLIRILLISRSVFPLSACGHLRIDFLFSPGAPEPHPLSSVKYSAIVARLLFTI